MDIEEIGSSCSEDDLDDVASVPAPKALKKQPAAAIKDEKAPALVRQLQHQQVAILATTVTMEPITSQQIVSSGPIKTSVQFESAWKSAKGNAQEQAIILQVPDDPWRHMICFLTHTSIRISTCPLCPLF